METLSGTIERVTYYNEENGYTVLKIIPDQRRLDTARDGTVAVVGIMPELMTGESVEFTGQWVEDKTYGKQFRAETVSTVLPTSRAGIISYLSSGLVKGIGPRTAERIVDHFGTETLNILERDPDRLQEVPEIKRDLLTKLAKAWASTQSARQAMIFLQGFGVSSRLAAKIFGQYGNETVRRVQADPYALADEVFGIGFIKADTIARSMGVEPDAHTRIRAGLSYALNQMANEGHTYMPRAELVTTAADLLKVDNAVRLDLAIGGQARNGELKSERIPGPEGETIEAIYLPMYYYAEVRIAQRLRRLKDTPSPIMEKAEKQDWRKLLAKLSKKGQVSLSQQQQGAVQAAMTNKVSVLTGGPGTGKTTTLRMVIEALFELGFKFALASPTGRAAKRLSESTNHPASTIHRLLGYTPAEGFMVDEDDPLKVDMVVIDETSMVDVMLFHQLLKAIKPDTHLMLVGDINQLPSVGAGNVLRDVIDSGLAHVTRLDTIFRQGEDSHIVVNAHRINHGDLPFMDNSSSDFYFFGADEPGQTAELVVDIVQNRLPKKFGCDPVRDIQVIAPMYRGPAGVDSLNDMLQRALNGPGRKAEKNFGGKTFRAGDKVMQTRNNYDKDVFNGDIGMIRGFDFDEDVMQVVMEDGMIVEYDWTEVEQLRHAFCISTHRSQGSEYSFVVIPVLTQHYMMLQRNLLYTAITRAKKVVVLVGSRKAVAMAVNNNKVERRYSGLLPRLKGHVVVGDIDEIE